LPCSIIQCDEIWSFCHAKEKNVPVQSLEQRRRCNRPLGRNTPRWASGAVQQRSRAGAKSARGPQQEGGDVDAWQGLHFCAVGWCSRLGFYHDRLRYDPPCRVMVVCLLRAVLNLDGEARVSQTGGPFSAISGFPTVVCRKR
jgi:hypothetical protein